MTDTQSPFRLIQPSQQLYDTDSGENAVLKNVTPENIGGMYGLLLDRTAKARANQDRYGDLLGSINRQQSELAREKLAGDQREAEMKLRLGLVEHGGVDVSAALSGLGMPGMPTTYSPEDSARSLLTTDGLRRALTGGKAFNEQMQGAHHGAEAGYTVDPWQQMPSTAAAAQRATVTTGAPMDITLQGMRDRAAAAKDAREDTEGTQASTAVDPSTGSNVTTFKNKTDPAAAINAGNAYDEYQRAMKRHLAQPTRFARPPPFVIPRGSTPLAQGAPTEGTPLTQQGNAQPAPRGVLAPNGRPMAPVHNIPPELAGPLPADNRRPSTGTVAGSNVSPNPPERTRTQSPPPLPADAVNRAKAAVPQIGRITGYEWTPEGGHVAIGERGKVRVGS